MRWYVNRSGQAEGPYDEAAVLNGARSGAAPRGCLVCPEGGSEWVAIERLPAFAAVLPPAPAIKKYEIAGHTLSKKDLIVVGSVVAFAGAGLAITTFLDSRPKNAASTLPQLPAVAPTATQFAMPRPGLGITRARLQAEYERDGFTFEQSSDVRGEPRVIGKSEDGLAYVEMIGDPADLTITTLMVGVTKETTLDATARSVKFLQRVAPDWEGSTDWLAKSLKKSPAESETTRGVKLFSVQPLPSTSMVVISVRREEPQ